MNLRGLGALRTLVLLNGRRVAPNPAIGAGVDINLFPSAAIGASRCSRMALQPPTVRTRSPASSTSSRKKASRVCRSTDRTATSTVPTATTAPTSRTGGSGESTEFAAAGGYRHRSELHTSDRDGRCARGRQSHGRLERVRAARARISRVGSRRASSIHSVPRLGGTYTGTVAGVGGVPPTGLASPRRGAIPVLAFDNLVEAKSTTRLRAARA